MSVSKHMLVHTSAILFHTAGSTQAIMSVSKHIHTLTVFFHRHSSSGYYCICIQAHALAYCYDFKWLSQLLTVKIQEFVIWLSLEHQQTNKTLMPFLALFIAFLLIGKEKSIKSIKKVEYFLSLFICWTFCMVKPGQIKMMLHIWWPT